MPFFLRRIRRARWIEARDSPEPANQETLGKLLDDIRPDENLQLSVWHIESDKLNLPRVVAALAVTRTNRFHPFDYALIEQQHLSQIGIKSKKTKGETFDVEANKLWHYELIELSNNKCVALIKYILEVGKISTRIEKRDIAGFIQHSLSEGYIREGERNKIHSNILSGIQKALREAQ